MNEILVTVQLERTSQPIYHDAITTYEKGAFFCILRPDDTVAKYPIANIWRVIEDYGYHLGDNDPKQTFAEKAVAAGGEGWAGSFGPEEEK